MSDRDLHGDDLKLVRYKLLFVKRDYEVVFYEAEDLVAEDMDEKSFAAWKTAEFIQRLGEKKTPVPRRWKDYPPEKSKDGHITYVTMVNNRKVLVGLPDDDKKFLRVYLEVLDRYPREESKYDKDQVDVLRGIREAVERIAPPPPHRRPQGGGAGGGGGGGGGEQYGGGGGGEEEEGDEGNEGGGRTRVQRGEQP
jgi:hypothetical protein